MGNPNRALEKKVRRKERCNEKGDILYDNQNIKQ